MTAYSAIMLRKALEGIGNPPCDTCEHKAHCAEGYACELFAHWSHYGTVKAVRTGEHGKSRRVDPGPAIPTRSIYLRLFPPRGKMSTSKRKVWSAQVTKSVAAHEEAAQVAI
jgi:hypothetical protein